MNTPIETHADGTLWVACTTDEPKSGTLLDGVNIYHPNAKVTDTGNYGGDDHYRCPHCKDSWWVEYD